MSTYQVTNGGEVTNTIVAGADFMLSQYPDGNYTLVPEPLAEPSPEARKITRLAFLSRFTDAEAITLDLASQGATVEAATMRRYLSKVNAATYIDLDRGDTRAGVIALEGAGILGAGRALVILDAPVQPDEVPQ
jgi:hypothetical protein